MCPPTNYSILLLNTSKCQTPLQRWTNTHNIVVPQVVQRVVKLLASRLLVVIPETDETRTSCRCCTTFCLQKSYWV